MLDNKTEGSVETLSPAPAITPSIKRGRKPKSESQEKAKKEKLLKENKIKQEKIAEENEKILERALKESESDFAKAKDQPEREKMTSATAPDCPVSIFTLLKIDFLHFSPGLL